MKRLRILGLSLLALFAFGVVMAGVALGEEGALGLSKALACRYPAANQTVTRTPPVHSPSKAAMEALSRSIR